ncbi:hypothetical protein PAHAL_2G069400 [Panicum hallii]|uniref:Uncharacterized protein n=1 Tax=Panicum hallii TaxID=206008 RepID=A0A2S3GWQ9_9POAL|nr:hypothetical protein PAHAL_2G069400 [Panicum hallii]PAN10060.1 hypothetical protein PAHAL_2G069400 [Panicum hallii]
MRSISRRCSSSGQHSISSAFCLHGTSSNDQRVCRHLWVEFQFSMLCADRRLWEPQVQRHRCNSRFCSSFHIGAALKWLSRSKQMVI